MNWVGGVRRRVLLREEERRRQDKFFAAHAASKHCHSTLRMAPSAPKQGHRGLNPLPRVGPQHSRNEDLICERIQTGSSSARRSYLDGADISSRCPSVDSNINTTPSEISRDIDKSDDESETQNIIIRKNGKKLIMKPSSLHGPFSRFLLQLEAEGIQKKLDQQDKEISRRKKSSRKELKHNHSKDELISELKRQSQVERHSLEERTSKERNVTNEENNLTLTGGSKSIDRSSRSEETLEKQKLRGKYKQQNKTDVIEKHMRKYEKKRENMKDKYMMQNQTIKSEDLRNGEHTLISKQHQEVMHNSKHIGEKERTKLTNATNVKYQGTDRTEKRKKMMNDDPEPSKKRKCNSGSSASLEARLSSSVNRRKKEDSSRSSDGRERDKKTCKESEGSIKVCGMLSDINKGLKGDIKTFSSSLLSGAPRIRKILTLSPDRYPGRCIWEPLELGKYNTSSKGGKYDQGNEGSNVNRNEREVKKTENKVSRGNGSQDLSKSSSVKIDKDKMKWEENRLALLLGPKPSGETLDFVGKWQNEHHDKPTLSSNHLTENSFLQCELNKIGKQFGARKLFVFEDSQQSHQQTGYESRSSRNINTQILADENHNTNLKYPPRLKLGERKLDINNNNHNAIGKSETLIQLPPTGKLKLSSMVRDVLKLETDSSFILRGRDKTPYMEKDLTLPTQCLTNNTSGGSSNKSSRTPSDSNFDKSFEESFCNDGKEVCNVGSSIAKGPPTVVDTYVTAETQDIGNIGKAPIMKPRFKEKYLQFCDDPTNSCQMYQSPYLSTKNCNQGVIDYCIPEESKTIRDSIHIGQKRCDKQGTDCEYVQDFSTSGEDTGDLQKPNCDFQTKNFYCEGVTISGYKSGEIRQPAVCHNNPNSCHVEINNYFLHSSSVIPSDKMDNLHAIYSSVANAKNKLIQKDHIDSINKAEGNLMAVTDRETQEGTEKHQFSPITHTRWEFKLPLSSGVSELPPNPEIITDIHAEFQASQLAEKDAKIGNISVGNFTNINDCAVAQRLLHFEAEYIFDWNSTDQGLKDDLERRRGPSEDFMIDKNKQDTVEIKSQDKWHLFDAVYPTVSGPEEAWPIVESHRGTFDFTDNSSTNHNDYIQLESSIIKPPTSPVDIQGNGQVLSDVNSCRKFTNESTEKENNIWDNSLAYNNIEDNEKDFNSKMKKVSLGECKRKVYIKQRLDDKSKQEGNSEDSSKVTTCISLGNFLSSVKNVKNLNAGQKRQRVDPEQAVRQFSEVMGLGEDDPVTSEGSLTSSSGTLQQVALTSQIGGLPLEVREKSDLEKIGEALLFYNAREGKVQGLPTTKSNSIECLSKKKKKVDLCFFC